jgi:hypothetical protein
MLPSFYTFLGKRGEKGRRISPQLRAENKSVDFLVTLVTKVTDKKNKNNIYNNNNN